MSLFREKRSIPRASFIRLSKCPVDEPPSIFPSVAPMERDVHFQSLFYVSSRVPSKGALTPGSLHRAPIQRNAPTPEPLFNHLSKSWVEDPPYRFLGGAMEKDAHLQSHLESVLHITHAVIPESSSSSSSSYSATALTV